jgi:sugar phosphate isomerase/epimerase
MQIGYCTWGMPTVPLDEALRHLAGLGFTGVEPTVIPGFTSELDTLDAVERRRIRALFDDLGLDMPAIAGHRSLLAVDADEHGENWRRLTGAIDLCVDWTAAGAQPPALDTTLGGSPADWDAQCQFIVERVGALVDYGASSGVVIALEPHVGSALDTPEKTLWLLQQIGSDFLKLNYDISHFDVQGMPTKETVASMAPHTVHTHVKDQRGRAPDHEFLIPGEGPFDFVEYLHEMEAAGYDGYITAEVSFMVQQRPDYDPFAAAELTWRTLDCAFRSAGLQ